MGKACKLWFLWKLGYFHGQIRHGVWTNCARLCVCLSPSTSLSLFLPISLSVSLPLSPYSRSIDLSFSVLLSLCLSSSNSRMYAHASDASPIATGPPNCCDRECTPHESAATGWRCWLRSPLDFIRDNKYATMKSLKIYRIKMNPHHPEKGLRSLPRTHAPS